MLLFVCHGNVCRSPMAEHLARQALGGQSELPTLSAGTHAPEGLRIHPKALRVLAEVDVDGADFRSRPVTASLVQQASLVVTASREQRAICARLAPTRLGRVFTLLQLARLVHAVGPERLSGVEPSGRLSAMLRAIAEVRGDLQPVSPQEDDLVDPVDGTVDDMRACREQISRSLEPVLSVIAAF